MAFPKIVYNASSGSDTAASGAGPATAVTGSSAAHTGGSATTTITLTNTPDLSGVATDGSAALWLNTSAGGRHITKITAVDDSADTVTVEDTFTIAGGSAVNYAIGGKRKTFENDTTRADWEDLNSGWIFEFNDGVYTATVQIGITTGDFTDGPVTWRSTNYRGAEITSTTLSYIIRIPDSTNAAWVFQDLKITRTVVASGGVLVFAPHNGTFAIRGCLIDANDGANSTGIAVSNDCAYEVEDCEIMDCIHGFSASDTNAGGVLARNSVHGCTNSITITASKSAQITENVIYDNAVGINIDGVIDLGNSFINIRNNTIFGNTGDGITLNDATATIEAGAVIEGNIIVGNGGFGIDASAQTGTTGTLIHADYNCVFDNTAGNYNNVVAGPNSISADPKFVSVTGGSEDFSLQASSPCIDAMPSGPTS